MLEQFSRTELLIGRENIEKLHNSKVAIFGIGGVGSYVVEGLVRAGVSNFILVDMDNVSITNLNRQIIATTTTIGKPKVEVAKDRILQINKEANVKIYNEFFPSSKFDILDDTIDYVVDAIDTVSSKIELISRTKELNIKIISCMGTGNKLDPTKFEICDISKTSVCPLARIIRKELRKRNINNLKVVYSKEEPIKDYYKCSDGESFEDENTLERKCRKQVPGSISFVPSVAGLIIAGEVVKDIING